MKDTLKEIEEEFDKEFNLVSGKYSDYPNGLKVKFTHNDIKSFLNSSIIKVLQHLVEREESGQKSFCRCLCEKTKLAIEYNSAKQDTIDYLKSEIATLSTNIDKK